MKYKDHDGKIHNSSFGAITSNITDYLDYVTHGKLSEFEKKINEPKKPDDYYDHAFIDWTAGFVRMYNNNGVEIMKVKIDTEYYRANK